MIIVKVNTNNERGLDVALKVFKNKVNKTKLIQHLRKRQEFVKPSVKRREQRLKAIYIQQLKDKEDN